LTAALHQVAALSGAGLPDQEAWAAVVDGGSPAALEAWAAGVAATEVGPYARAVCAIAQLGREVGVACGALVGALTLSLERHQDAADALAVAVAGPKASARLLQYLPLAGLGLGWVMGVNVFSVVSDAGLGTFALAVGLGLLLAGKAWTAALLRRAAVGLDVEVLVAADLLAAALSAGLTIPGALQAVARCWPGPAGRSLGQVGTRLARGDEWAAAWAGRDPAGLEAALAVGWRSGVGCAGLLAAFKAGLLRSQQRAALLAAGRAGVWLMAPLGLCYLPSFMALGLAPLLISLARGLSLGL
jgi:tight adherence protein B